MTLRRFSGMAAFRKNLRVKSVEETSMKRCKHENTERLAAPGAGNYSPCHEYCKNCGGKRYWPNGMSTQMLYGPAGHEGEWPQPKWQLPKNLKP